MQNEINIKCDFTEYKKFFIEQNHKLNLISKNDEQFLYEKHIYDSLGIALFFKKYKINSCTILDIGCGGGFPCVPIAMEYPEYNVTGIDSIRKKIVAVEEIKRKMNITNLTLVCGRVENLITEKFDIIVSRAVTDLTNVIKYAEPHLKKEGYIIVYKSRKVDEEIKLAQEILCQKKLKIIDIIKYSLPLDEVYERNLVVIKYV